MDRQICIQSYRKNDTGVNVRATSTANGDRQTDNHMLRKEYIKLTAFLIQTRLPMVGCLWQTDRQTDRQTIQGAPKNFTPLCRGKSRLHFVEEKAKINVAYYVGSLLPMLVDDCERLLPFGFVFQQDGAPVHTARQTQNWLTANCTDFIAKDQWPPNSPDLNPLDYHVWGAMLQAFHKLHPKPKTIPELKSALQQIWDDLPQTTINKAISDFRKRLNSCVSAGGSKTRDGRVV